MQLPGNFLETKISDIPVGLGAIKVRRANGNNAVISQRTASLPT